MRTDGNARARYGVLAENHLCMEFDMKRWLTCGAKNRRGLPCQCKELFENGRSYIPHIADAFFC